MSVGESEKVKKYFDRPKSFWKKPQHNLRSLRAIRLLKAMPSVPDNSCYSPVVANTKQHAQLDGAGRAKLLRRTASARARMNHPGGGREGPTKCQRAHHQLKMDAFVTSTESPSSDGKARYLNH